MTTESRTLPCSAPRPDRTRLRGIPLLIVLAATSACSSGSTRTNPGHGLTYGAVWLHGGDASPGSAESPWITSTVAREARLTGDDSQLLVEAKVNGRVSGVFLLDTGASYCVITPDVARRLGVGTQDTNDTITLATPTGEIEAPMTTLRTVEVARTRAGNVSAVIYPAVAEPLSGIIGLSFLSQFEFSIDSRRRLLRLRPF
jgi:clan AA aspartic protease (TIGR02281 family)